MSTSRWIASILIVFHLTALTLDAIPDPGQLNIVGPERLPSDDRLAALVTPALDRSALVLSELEPSLYSRLASLRLMTLPYIKAGLRQKWNMFSNPPIHDSYLRLNYYVAREGEPAPRAFQELVFPEDREDQARIVHRFRDKAMSSAIERQFTALMEKARDGRAGKDDSAASAVQPRDVPPHFIPLMRYFSQRFHARHLSSPERVVRTELWYGAAAIPGRGKRVAPDVLEARLEALRRYHQGPVSLGVMRSSFPTRGSSERETDIVWTLEDTLQQ